jgi:hypothetical protein
MKPFNREKFLLYMLAGIFVWQAALFTGGVIGCFRIGGKEACPNLGDRYENTVGIMVATTLALLGAGAVVNQRRPSSSDDRDGSSASQPPLQLQQPSLKDSSPAAPPVQGQEKKPERGGRKA